MTLQTMLRYATLWSLLVAIISLIVVVHISRRQMQAHLYLEVGKRFDDLLNALPPGVWLARLAPETNLPPPTAELTSNVHRYFAFLLFMYCLADERYLPPAMLRILHAGIHRTLVSPLFAREWSTLRTEFEPYPEFVNFVDALQSKTAPSLHVLAKKFATRRPGKVL